MIIGINSNLIKAEGKIFDRLAMDYSSAITQAGGIPVILPCIRNSKIISAFLETIDGLVISGGGDTHPATYGEKLLLQTKPVFEDKQWFDLKLICLAWHKRIPTLAICYGAQLLNVALGGTLFQDIKTQLKLSSHNNRTHRVYISENSFLYKIIKKPWVQTNSFHHQAINEVGAGLCISAKSEDGLIEAIEASGHKRFFIGVQWHPERMMDNRDMMNLFRELIIQAKSNCKNGH